MSHVSVLLNEAVGALNIKPDGVYADGTLGGGGHSLKICGELSEKGRLIAVDRDGFAIDYAKNVLKGLKPRISFVNDNFSNIKAILEDLGIDGIDGALLDLGVSSFQLDTEERGFSYMKDAPLDMRMDRSRGLTAYDVINTYSEDRLADICINYGEERWAKRICRFIAESRSIKPIETTYELVGIIKAAIPKKARENGPHPAKRIFQAVRIEVNGELEILEGALNDITDKLNPGGRLCVITFHSLEDRIVKNTFNRLENPCTCPRDLPVCVCGKVPKLRAVTRKPTLPPEDEIARNPRARSAKLRVAERV